MVDLASIFKDGFDISNTCQSNGINQPSFLDVYPIIPAGDKEAMAVIEPDLEKGPWIAGGAPLRWYQGRVVDDSDIDVFCRNALQAQKVIERIKSYGRFEVKHESDNAVTIRYHRKDEYGTAWIIQVITRRYFDRLQEVLDNFDITVCQIGTTGTEWVLNPMTARDIREHNLRFTEPLHPDAAKRLTKYWTYGYRPVPGTIESIQNNPLATWKFTADGDYENAF
jgi:hypothetical protein